MKTKAGPIVTQPASPADAVPQELRDHYTRDGRPVPEAMRQAWNILQRAPSVVPEARRGLLDEFFETVRAEEELQDMLLQEGQPVFGYNLLAASRIVFQGEEGDNSDLFDPNPPENDNPDDPRSRPPDHTGSKKDTPKTVELMCLLAHADLAPDPKFVAQIMSAYVNQFWEVFPSLTRLAREAQHHVTWVRRQVRYLEAQGILRARGVNEKYQTHIYQFNLATLQSLQPEPRPKGFRYMEGRRGRPIHGTRSKPKPSSLHQHAQGRSAVSPKPKPSKTSKTPKTPSESTRGLKGGIKNKPRVRALVNPEREHSQTPSESTRKPRVRALDYPSLYPTQLSESSNLPPGSATPGGGSNKTASPSLDELATIVRLKGIAEDTSLADLEATPVDAFAREEAPGFNDRLGRMFGGEAEPEPDGLESVPLKPDPSDGHDPSMIEPALLLKARLRPEPAKPPGWNLAPEIRAMFSPARPARPDPTPDASDSYEARAEAYGRRVAQDIIARRSRRTSSLEPKGPQAVARGLGAALRRVLEPGK
jgi:hypothetical protein